MGEGSLHGKVAVITGAGIGDRESVAPPPSASPPRSTRRAVVGDSDYIESLVADAVGSFGGLDVMHNNAGYG